MNEIYLSISQLYIISFIPCEVFLSLLPESRTTTLPPLANSTEQIKWPLHWYMMSLMIIGTEVCFQMLQTRNRANLLIVVSDVDAFVIVQLDHHIFLCTLLSVDCF